MQKIVHFGKWKVTGRENDSGNAFLKMPLFAVSKMAPKDYEDIAKRHGMKKHFYRQARALFAASDLCLKQGIAKHDAEEYTAAIRLYNNAVGCRAEGDFVWFNKVEKMVLGREESMARDMKNSAIYKLVGDAKFARGRMNDYADAVWNYDKAISINPNNEGAYQGRAEVEKKLGNHDAAFSDSCKAADILEKKAQEYAVFNQFVNQLSAY